MTSKRHRQVVDGLLLLDKPKGMTSNAVLQKVKYIFNAQKAGHSGSLDPLASGLLPICFGEATKFSRFLLESDKTYQVTALLGIRTDSGDSEGKIIEERSIPDFSNEAIENVLKDFRGSIFQIPSQYSALKYQGQPLYKYARQGIEIERAARPLTIHSLEIIDYQNHRLTLDIKATKGTYVRTLVDDIGEALGCGAHVVQLRRLGAGPYTASQMITLETLEKIAEETPEKLMDYLLPLGTSVVGIPDVVLSDAAAFYLRRGQAVILPYTPTEGFVKLTLKSSGFLGIGEILEDGRVAPKRLVSQGTASI